MRFTQDNPLVFTIKDRCRICYTCVRECPAKAIKIEDGQAQVIVERCIGCGNCVMVCSQGAKVYFNSIDNVLNLLDSSEKVIACIAPSFPAEFGEAEDYRLFVGMVRKLGFYKVVEVGFGADLVAAEYKRLYQSADKGYINSDCPAVMYYVRQYMPELTDHLAPIDSPAMALAKALKKKYGQDIKLVFIGPCVAKKAESELFDDVLTFAELRRIFVRKRINVKVAQPSDFDPPHAGRGAIFPVSSGLSRTIGEDSCGLENRIIIASGRKAFKEALREFHNNGMSKYHLELLACDGCIAGPGITNSDSVFRRRLRVERYVAQKMQNFNYDEWKKEFDQYADLDLSREFTPMDRRLPVPSDQDIEAVLHRLGKYTPQDHLNCGACGYDTCMEHAIAIAQGMAEEEMCLPHTIEKLHETIEQLHEAQEALVQSEKLASMGQLSAGIAHELNNPLGVITLYANIICDEVPEDSQIYQDVKVIAEQADRCKKIVSGLLNFARKQSVNLRETNLAEFMKKALKSVVIPRNIEIEFKNNLNNETIWLDTDQMMQAITNILKNAVEAMPEGGRLTIELEEAEDEFVKITIGDTGCGIPKENIDRIFTPFFTTKKQGGTGLGLPLVYGIVKMHKGKIFVKSNADPKQGPTWTKFIITLPRNPKKL